MRHPQLYFKELLSADTNPAGAPATADGGAENKGNLEEKSGGGFFGKLFKGGGGDGPKGAAAEARARAKEEAASDPLLPLRPRLAEFHPSFTLLGSQPSFCLALAGGIIAKINRPGAERVVHSRPLFLPRGLATDEEADEGALALPGAAGSGAKVAKAARSGAKKGRATDAPTAVASESVTREYFSGHSQQVICLGFVEHSSQMVSLDASGQLLLWQYRQEHYSSFGWFRPSRQKQIGSTMKSVTLDPDSVELLFPPEGVSVPRRTARGYPKRYLRLAERYDRLRIAPLRLPQQAWKTVRLDNGAVRKTFGDPERATASRPTVAHSVTRDEGGVLVRHTTSSYRLRQISGELLLACMSPSAAEMATLTYYADVPEGPQLRLMLLELINLTWRPVKITLPRQTDLAPLMALGPLLDVPAADYAFLLVDNAVRVYSLGSSTQVLALRPLGDARDPPLDSMALGGDGRSLAVGCSKQGCFWLYNLAGPAAGAQVRTNLLAVRAGSARLRSIPVEQRVREHGWLLGQDASGYPNDRANVAAFMRRTAYQIVDLAMAKVADGRGSAPAAASRSSKRERKSRTRFNESG